MRFTPRMDRAIKKAAQLHLDQYRKSPDPIPYVAHPYSVAIILSNYTDDEDTMVAGLLHDSIEDTNYTPEQLEEDFGHRIKEIVMGVTEPKLDESGQKLPWQVRKDAYLENLKTVSQASLMLSAADKICNMRNMVDDYDKYGDEILKKFSSSPEDRYKYHSAVLEILKDRLEKKDILTDYEWLLKDTEKFNK